VLVAGGHIDATQNDVLAQNTEAMRRARSMVPSFSVHGL
jgi:hypothetical protein